MNITVKKLAELHRLLPLLTRIPTPTSSRSPLTMRASTTNPSRSTGAS